MLSGWRARTRPSGSEVGEWCGFYEKKVVALESREDAHPKRENKRQGSERRCTGVRGPPFFSYPSLSSGVSSAVVCAVCPLLRSHTFSDFFFLNVFRCCRHLCFRFDFPLSARQTRANTDTSPRTRVPKDVHVDVCVPHRLTRDCCAYTALLRNRLSQRQLRRLSLALPVCVCVRVKAVRNKKGRLRSVRHSR